MVKLFSIKEKHSNRIFNKEKQVEFRRQNVNISEKELCLIYTSSPVKKITGSFIVKRKIRTSIFKLWRLTKNDSGLTFKEFREYFEGCKTGTGIVFTQVKKLKNTITLYEIRIKFENFMPPQSYCNLEGKLYDYLESKIN